MKRRRSRGRFFVISFAITVVVLIGLVAFLLTANPTFEVPNHSIPSSLPAYPVDWARYVPSNILTVSVINYSSIRSLNASAVPSDNLLELTSPRENLTAGMVNALVSVSFTTPNATASLIYMPSAAFTQFAAPVVANSGKSFSSSPSFYYTSTKEGNKSQFGWLALVPQDNIVAFAFGASPAQQAINLCLEAANGTAANIMTRTDIHQILYILNGSENHVSLQVQNFPGVVATGKLTVVSVDDVGSSVHVSYVVAFQDATTAQSQEGYMRGSYLSATSFGQYDQYLRATEYEPFSQLQFAVRLVGG